MVREALVPDTMDFELPSTAHCGEGAAADRHGLRALGQGVARPINPLPLR